MQITPQRAFYIVWNGADPSDTDTLFVQAVVRDAKTRTILATVNLTDRGSHYFDTEYIAPHDNSQTSQGRQILIALTVYSDAGYTTPNLNYARETAHYIVQDRVDPAKFYGVSGGDFDIKGLMVLIEAALDARKPAAIAPTIFPVAEILDGVKTQLSQLPKFEQKEIDLSGLEQGLNSILLGIDSMPRFEKTDMTPVLKEVRGMSPFVKALLGELQKNMSSIITTAMKSSSQDLIKAVTAEVVKEISAQLKDGKLAISLFGSSSPGQPDSNAKRDAFMNSLKRKAGIK